MRRLFVLLRLINQERFDAAVVTGNLHDVGIDLGELLVGSIVVIDGRRE